MARKRFKTTQHESTVAGALDDASSAREELAREMRDWADNMEENLSHTEKYEQVSEAADALENVDLELEVPECLEDIKIKYSNHSPYGRRGPSRAMRRDNIVEALQAIMTRAEEEESELEGQKNDAEANGDTEDREFEEIEDNLSAIEEFKGFVSDAIDELDAVEFPGMY